jgi:hypothetical protein
METTSPEPASRVIAIRPAQELDRHRRRELATIEAMFRIYCRDHHQRDAFTCEECAPLVDYATRRLVRCVFGADKPTCANCTVHCYTPTMRTRIKDVMRYAGPRMLWRHPYLAITHVTDGRRPAPVLAKKAATRG